MTQSLQGPKALLDSINPGKWVLELRCVSRHGVLYFETKLHVEEIRTWEGGMETTVTTEYPLLKNVVWSRAETTYCYIFQTTPLTRLRDVKPSVTPYMYTSRYQLLVLEISSVDPGYGPARSLCSQHSPSQIVVSTCRKPPT